MTIVGITKEGWCYAPWKKPKGGAKTVRSPDAKQLFELADVAERNGHRAIRAMRVFAFEREGKSDKGARQDELVADIAVGMTLRFKIHDFMYEVKTGRDNVFPSGIEFIPEFSLVEIMILPGKSLCYLCRFEGNAFCVNFEPLRVEEGTICSNLETPSIFVSLKDPRAAGTTDSATKGFGLSLSTIRPLEHTLHSYLHPLGLGLLPPTYDAAVGLATGLAGRGAPIQAMIETSCVSFFAAVSPKAFLSPVAETMYRLTCPDGPVVESLHEVDVRTEDLLRYTNAGEDLGYALFLTDLAASAGALSVFVVRDPYYQASAGPSVVSSLPGLTPFPGGGPLCRFEHARADPLPAEGRPRVRRAPRDPPDRHGEAARLRGHVGLDGRGRRGPVRPALPHRHARPALRRRGHGPGAQPRRRAPVPRLCPAVRDGPVQQGLPHLHRGREPGDSRVACVARSSCHFLTIP